MSVVLPGATLGMLGGGQLGRMFCIAAQRMGYRTHVFCPEAAPPAASVCDTLVRAPYDDLDTLRSFARGVAAISFEFENVPAATAEAAAEHCRVRPAGSVLQAAQDRMLEKGTLSRFGIPVAPYATIEDEAELAAAASKVGPDGVLKSSTAGYDGKGQERVRPGSSLQEAWESLGRVPAVYEGFVSFEREISVVGARGVDGSTALYTPFENEHTERHVLDRTIWPARIPDAVAAAAQELARKVLEALDVVGVLCVEMFALADGRLLVNEIAPRPHNSGHLSIEAFEACQFEQQVRSLCGLPLGSTAARVPAACMVNLLGDLWADGEPNWVRALEMPGVSLHLYGKTEARPGRKMGHLTVVGADRDEVADRALAARARLTAGGAAD